MNKRIFIGVERPAKVPIEINGDLTETYLNESLATALLAFGITVFNRNRQGDCRGPYCNMGTCFECLVGIQQSRPGEEKTEKAEKDERVEKVQWVRACMTPVTEGLSVVVGDSVDTLNNSSIRGRHGR
ncbi:(2Fe-2S)-binding protein [Pseudomaricurvus alkylphenolicus]|uniref:2Fe-2S iron-sulfur cluster-binding protein n=1 Tax=Pseudomaricurvus alkylphenolicus TaxID=1306991 RepID=UPI00142406C1|nr:2Fe-2S iron-sulfur cluster-binding protein [Pseudomaricurvus alkylphenolicus]NIB40300.1 (2Fe-2S)-binding protein [Pseudomaricurvus alkylphenolicus]